MTWELIGKDELVTCPQCSAEMCIAVFPAFFNVNRLGMKGELLLEDNLSSCFYHVEKKAVVACEECGRFLCMLCEIDISNKKLCPLCMQSLRKKGEAEALSGRSTAYDELALTLSILPVLTVFFTLLTAPASLYLVIKNWRKPQGFYPRSKARFIVAGILSIIQIIAWAVFFIYLAIR